MPKKKQPAAQPEAAGPIVGGTRDREEVSYVHRVQITYASIQAAEEAWKRQPDDPVAARNLLRALVRPCYPTYSEVALSMALHEDAMPPQARSAARVGLEIVLFAMDFKQMTDVVADPDMRMPFLSALADMLKPFRALKAAQSEGTQQMSKETLDLNTAFEFRATKRGNRTPEKMDAEFAAQWVQPCFDVHLLVLAGKGITQAINRVAGVHNRADDALRAAYKKWRNDPVQKEVLRRGDAHAQNGLSQSQVKDLIQTAF